MANRRAASATPTTSSTLEVKDAPTLRKHTAAVHSTGLKLLQRKLYNALLLSAYDHLLERAEHEVPLAVVKALIEYDSKDQRALRDALAQIRSRNVEFNLLHHSVNGDTATWTVTGLISEATIARGMVTYSFGRKMAEALFNPETYALISLSVQAKLSSSFSLNLYENCARFRGTGSTGKIPIETLRKLLDAGAPLYDEFKRLNTRVLQPAIAEVNEKSDLILSMEVERETSKGRPVRAVTFLVKENPQRPLIPFPVDQHDELRDHPAYRKLRELKVADRVALMAVNENPAWAEEIARFVEREHQRGKVKSPAGYAAKLIHSKAELSPMQRGAKSTPAAAPTPTPAVPAATPREADSGDYDARIRRAFETARRARAMAQVKPEELLDWKKRWRDFAAQEESFMLRGCNFETGELTSMGQSAFERYVTRQLLGEVAEGEQQRWVASRVT